MEDIPNGRSTFICSGCGQTFSVELEAGKIGDKSFCATCYIQQASTVVQKEEEKAKARRNVWTAKKSRTLLFGLIIAAVITFVVSMWINVENKPQELTLERRLKFSEIQANEVSGWVIEYQEETGFLPESLGELANYPEIEAETEMLQQFTYSVTGDNSFKLECQVEHGDVVQKVTYRYPR